MTFRTVSVAAIAAVLTTAIAACSGGSTPTPGPAPATPPPYASTILTAAQAPATIFVPSVALAIPPQASAGAVPGAPVTTASTTISIPVTTPTTALAACPVATAAPGSSATPAPASTPCPTVVSFQVSGVAPAGISGLTNGLAYVLVTANAPVTLSAPPTLAFTLGPYPGGTLRLFQYNGSGWADTGIAGVQTNTTITFAPPAGAGTFAAGPSAGAYALVLQ